MPRNDMRIDWDGSGACACYAIKNLGMMENAEMAMQRFCQLMLAKKAARYTWDANPNQKYYTLPAFIMFVSGPEVSGKTWSREWIRYGSDFAKFLRRNKMGTVVTAGKALNRKHHAKEGTDAQVWIWKVNQEAVEKWWENRLASNQIKPRLIRPRSHNNDYMYCPRCGNTAKFHNQEWHCRNPYYRGTVTGYTMYDQEWKNETWPEFEIYDKDGSSRMV